MFASFTIVDDVANSNQCAIVLSTRRDTKKFTSIMSNPRVAVLVHDFEAGQQGTASVTINGTVRIAQPGDEEDRCRAHHLQKNPKMEQFIAGANVAILIVTPESARICNIKDQVLYADLD